MNPVLLEYIDSISVRGPALREQILARAREDENISEHEMDVLCEFAGGTP